LGGTGREFSRDVAVDSGGAVYVVGETESTDFPVEKPIFGSFSVVFDIFITKMNATGDALVYSTYIGGSDDEKGWGIAIDSTGAAYVIGYTDSSDFPTKNPIQATHAGGTDVCYFKINSVGNALLYSSFLGGNFFDEGHDIAVDAGGRAYLTGQTYSFNFPMFNPLQGTKGGGHDVFVTVINAPGNAYVYSTYFGGSSDDVSQGIALDSGGAVYIAGYTVSTNFPTLGPIQGSLAGNEDAFITKINSAGSALVYSTYLGGSQYDVGTCIALDSSGRAYVAGVTQSTDFPTQNAIFNTFAGGEQDAFVARINSSGNTLLYSTFLGGSHNDWPWSVVAGSSGEAYVAGYTLSDDFPTRNPIIGSHGGLSDGFVTNINSQGSGLVYSTYLGGIGADFAENLCLDSTGILYVTGSTYSDDFPTQSGFQSSRAGGSDAFILKLVCLQTDDLLGTWSSGVWYRNSDTGSWVNQGSPCELVAAGDLGGDGTDDIFWSRAGDGVWVKQSVTRSWTKLCNAPARDMDAGDMNGDGRDDLLGNWSSGIYYKNSVSGAWVKMGPPGDLIATGDLDGDGTDDLLWSKAGDGVWIKSSTTTLWSRLTPAAAGDMTSGDMNGDGRDDLVGSWTSGVYYKDSIGGGWIKMGPPGELIASGDLDGDGTDDLLWSKSGDGVWVKSSTTALWSRLTPAASTHMDAGLMREGAHPWPDSTHGAFFELPAHAGGYTDGPGRILEYVDLSDEGPGGWNFVFSEEANVVLQESDSGKVMQLPGPGEAGFQYIEQTNLVPQEVLKYKKK
jgi:hypothetical protein